MKALFGGGIAGISLIVLTLFCLPGHYAIAGIPETPAVILALESGQMEALFAATDQGSPNLTGIYNQLKQIAKDYRKADSAEMKKGLADRADDLMGQLFDAKVQSEQNRIEMLEQRLNTEKDRLHQMQLHKRDMVHKAVQKALVSGGPGIA